jgi:hypothetical protein
MGITSFPEHALSTDDITVLAQQAGIEQVAGLLVGDVAEEEYGFDMDIGLNVDGGLDHGFYFDLIIATDEMIAVAAYPRPDLPAAADIGPIDDPLEPITDDAHEWEWIYREATAETSIEDVMNAVKAYREFAPDEETWVDSVAASGVLSCITH